MLIQCLCGSEIRGGRPRQTTSGFHAMSMEQPHWGREEQFRLLIEGAMDYAIFLIDPDERIASWNPGAERILGYTQEEIVGQPFARIFTPEDIAAGEPEQELKTARMSGR